MSNFWPLLTSRARGVHQAVILRTIGHPHTTEGVQAIPDIYYLLTGASSERTTVPIGTMPASQLGVLPLLFTESIL